jgi:hypothetical protein
MMAVLVQTERSDRSLAQVAMENWINDNLVRRWQREVYGDFELLLVQVVQSGSLFL